MDSLCLHQLPHFLRRVLGVVDGEDGLVLHVVQVRPHGVQGQPVLVELTDYLGELLVVAVSPSALVVA